jgi:hypothetical protein
MPNIIYAIMRQKRNTADWFSQNNPILDDGQMGIISSGQHGAGSNSAMGRRTGITCLGRLRPPPPGSWALSPGVISIYTVRLIPTVRLLLMGCKIR